MRYKKNIYIIVVDGMPDIPQGITALKKASKPNIDTLAKNGIVGRFLPISKKNWNKTAFASASQIGNLGILGYDASKYYVRRGPLEAIGADLEYQNGWLAIRGDIATVDENLIIKDRRAGRNILGLDLLIDDLNEKIHVGYKFHMQRTFGHRVSLVFKTNDLSDKITDSDPFKTGVRPNKVKPLNRRSKKAVRTAKVLNEFLKKFHELAKKHRVNVDRIAKGILPANYLLTRDAGTSLPKLESFFSVFGFDNGVAIAENGVMKATCKLAGFDSISVPEMSHESMLDFAFEKAKHPSVKREYQIIYMHLKGVDEAGHDKNLEKKIKAIEEIDYRMEYFIDRDDIVILLSDHRTDYRTGKHEYGYVPVLIYGLGKDNYKKFDEFTAMKSRLIFNTGKQLWRFIAKRFEKE